jgi:hypothetical protein
MSLSLSGMIYHFDLTRDVAFSFLAMGGPDMPPLTGGIFRLIFDLAGRGIHVVQVGVAPELIAPGAQIRLDGNLSNAFVYVDPNQLPFFLGTVTDGMLTFAETSGQPVAGETISGTLSAELSQFFSRPGSCPGDCNADRAVTVEELVFGVNLALGGESDQHCFAIDRDENFQVTVNELVRSVSSALEGCPLFGVFVDLGGMPPPPL